MEKNRCNQFHAWGLKWLFKPRIPAASCMSTVEMYIKISHKGMIAGVQLVGGSVSASHFVQ